MKKELIILGERGVYHGWRCLNHARIGTKNDVEPWTKSFLCVASLENTHKRIGVSGESDYFL